MSKMIHFTFLGYYLNSEISHSIFFKGFSNILYVQICFCSHIKDNYYYYLITPISSFIQFFQKIIKRENYPLRCVTK